MVRVIWEVLKDLWYFVRHKSSVIVDNSEKINTESTESTLKIEKINNVSLKPLIIPENREGELIGWNAYVQIETASYFSQPELLIDTKLGTFSYGDKVMVTRSAKDFVEVSTVSKRGWVYADSVTEDSRLVMPILKPAYIYGTNHEQTIRLRRLIKDEVLGQQLGLPLQSIEYVLFVLKREQITVPWPARRPRLPGSWKTLLRGLKGVSLSLEPHTGAILEYAGDDNIPGFLGYVEAVRPDLTITLQSVGRVEEGEYRVEECSRDMWKEWRPVFISFT